MGRREIVTAPALRDVLDLARTIRRVATQPDVSQGSLTLMRVQADTAVASTTFAHNRAQASDIALHMVFGERTIAEKCAKARLPVRLFDFGPEPEAA
jgi:hypothetical protein